MPPAPQPQEEQAHFLDYLRVLRSRKEIVISIVLLIVMAGVLITLFVMPKVYMASTRIAIEQNRPDVEVWGNGGVSGTFSYTYLQTQFEIIQSRNILYEVIRRLQLERKFGEAYGYAGAPDALQHTVGVLSRRIRVQQYRDTNLIEIQVSLSRPEGEANQLAAEIANEVAEVFRYMRHEVKREQKSAALDSLESQYRDQLVTVATLEEQLNKVRETFELGGSSGQARAGDIESYRLRLLTTRYTDKLIEASNKRVLAERIRDMSDADLLSTQDFIVQNRTLAALQAEKDSVDLELEDLLKDHGENHPKILSRRAVKLELEKKIADALRGLRTGIRIEAEKAAAELQALKDELDTAKREDVESETTGRLALEKAERELLQARRIAEVLQLRLRQERIDLELPTTTVEVIDRAEPPSMDRPVSPNLLVNLIVSILIGVGCGMGVAFFMEYVDTSIRTVEDIERYIGSSVMGIIPQKVLPLIEEGPESPHAEAYRVLRTNARFSKAFAGGRTLCVTSGSVGEGKSLTTANLAYVCAQLGERVLVIDSDLRRPRQHRILGVSNKHGLADVIQGKASLDEMIIQTEVPNLYFLPSGKLPQASQGLLDSTRMRDVLSKVREQFDVTLLDAPPMMGVSDASVLVSEADGTLLVIQYRKYPRSVSARARNLIENVGGTLLGVVLNNINISRDSYYYYYYHTYYSAYSRPDESRARSGGKKTRQEKNA